MCVVRDECAPSLALILQATDRPSGEPTEERERKMFERSRKEKDGELKKVSGWKERKNEKLLRKLPKKEKEANGKEMERERSNR